MKQGHRHQAQREVRWLILQSRVTAQVTRPQTAGEGTFFGAAESGEEQLGAVPIEMQDLPPKDLTEIGADAVASVLPDAGVHENDFLAVGETRYRVTEVKPQNFFGAVTHLELHLERERRDG